jgi:hypothetical protein
MSGATRDPHESQRAMNPVTLERLIANGSDLSFPHRLLNVFHVYDRSHLEPLCRDLKAAGFQIHDSGTPHVYQGVHYWKVEGALEVVPALAAVNSMTDRCVDIATSFGADYDGWYTEVVRPRGGPQPGLPPHPK